MILHILVAIAAAMTPEEAVNAALERDPALVAARASVLVASGERRAATGLRANPNGAASGLAPDAAGTADAALAMDSDSLNAR